jgi:hypothetical protein
MLWYLWEIISWNPFLPKIMAFEINILKKLKTKYWREKPSNPGDIEDYPLLGREIKTILNRAGKGHRAKEKTCGKLALFHVKDIAHEMPSCFLLLLSWSQICP